MARRTAGVLIGSVLLSVLVEVTGKGTGTGGSGGSSTGGGAISATGGGKAAAYSASSVGPVTGTKAGGKWSPSTGAVTSGGSSVVNSNGRAMSTRPGVYGSSLYSGSFIPRPVLYVGAAYLGYRFYTGAAFRDCSNTGEARFQYGDNCRKCSDWACPVGQYRTSCSQNSDSYCKLCTNKPEGDFIYTSPGNANDCLYDACIPQPSTDGQEYVCEGVVDPNFVGAEFSADSSAELVFYAEMPVDTSTFNSLGNTYKQAISDLADGAPVTVSDIEPVPASTFTRMGKQAVSGSHSGSPSEAQRREARRQGAQTPLPVSLCDTPQQVGTETVVVETTVSTTLSKVDALWKKLNEYDLNGKFQSECLPPVVIKYGDMASAGARAAPSLCLAALLSLLVSLYAVKE